MEKPNALDFESIKKEDAVQDLLEDSATFIDPKLAEKRLRGLKNAKVLNPAQISEEVERVSGLKLPKDKVGGIIVPDGDNKLDRLALLEQVESSVVAYHTAVHEGIHLLGPDSTGGKDLHERNYVKKSLGPRWTTLYFDEDGRVCDFLPIEDEGKLFWEAVTDFVAAEKTSMKFGREVTDDKLTEAGVGFLQRYWIEFLIKNHPAPDEFLKTIKLALYKGEETDFLRVLGGRLDNPHVPFYHTLASYMLEGERALNEGRPVDYDAAVEKWMTAIKYHFENGGAYSLDMTHF